MVNILLLFSEFGEISESRKESVVHIKRITECVNRRVERTPTFGIKEIGVCCSKSVERIKRRFRVDHVVDSIKEIDKEIDEYICHSR